MTGTVRRPFSAFRTAIGRRWGVTAGATAVLLGTAAVTAPVVFAEEQPKRALQAVTIALANDGAVTGLTSTLVSRDEDGESPSTTSRALNPAEHAGDLPVRVTTSWRHDGRVGTDLSDVEGVSGRVEINVTVQNTTMRPELFRYDAAGVARESYELVTTPMTVVASATLPGDSAGQLVQPQAGSTEPGTTNGVVSTDEETTTVQWASLLAPPRMAPSTTFTLVQDAEEFRLPQIDLAVQPGLATDNSVARLVSDVFGGSAALVGAENNTIGLIAEVNATLAQVTDSLATVQQTLSVNAGEVGAAATTALTATADSVDVSMQALMADLKALDDSVGATVEGANSRATGALDQSVQGVLDFFGTPDEAQGPVEAGCGDQTAAEAPATTLLGQLSTVSRQLRGLASASGDCVGELRTALQTSIGSAADCDAQSTSLVCQLTGAGSKLTGLADTLGTQVAGIRSLVETDAITDVKTQLADLRGALAAAQRAGADLHQPRNAGTTGQLTALNAIAKAITDAFAAVPAPTDHTSLIAELNAVSALADERVGDLTPADLQAVANQVCALTGTDQASVNAVSEAIGGGTCDDSEGTATEPSLLDKLTDQVADWQRVKTVTANAASALTAAQSQVASLRAALTGLQSDVTDLRGLVVGGDTSLGTAIDGLRAQLDALYDDQAVTPDCTSTPGTTPSVNAVAAAFAVVECNQADVATALGGLDTTATDVRGAGADDVAKAAEDAELAGTAADASLGGLSTTLADRLNGSADQQLEQGRAVVAAQTARLQAVEAAAQQELDAAAQEAVGRLAEQISAATTSQTAAADELQAQLQKVLIDLGSAAEGRGLLGVMQNSAGQTGVRNEQVQETSEDAASYRGVRLAEVADAQLEQQQLARSLQAAQRTGAFAEDLPAGSVSSTVFCFRIGGDA
ncbi:hypothetical protein [Blastococcus haudaquaticus]|uniref:Uncharacterized protein n=1 Tax=Blastococcus haudaquaticus TaxID=1938745 RepID=A0A286H139_9ACTN|nr:hypothetical protein [Blastococcus haudaquaticus]SOE01461.1 hypothetical protein SAMN06272739_3173 [Blastococcus haudaquaticus]